MKKSMQKKVEDSNRLLEEKTKLCEEQAIKI